MSYFEKRLQEVAGYFAAGDAHLGYRRLLDAGIETGNFDVYKETLKFCDWYDTITDTTDKAMLSANVNALLQIMANGYNGVEQNRVKARLSADAVTKQYTHGKFSLSATNVQLRPAEIIGLVGENGNGKTTLLRLLHGELLPDSGTVRYHMNGSANPPTSFQTKTALAFIPQRPQQWYGGLMDNLQYAATFTGYKDPQNRLWTEMIVARMGLRPYRTYNWSRISSGYKMRFELARTLIRKPQVLLLDEPLANLDMLAQQIILEDLRYLAQSYTAPLSIILSSQQLYEVEKVSDQVIFLQKGVPKYQYQEAASATVITATSLTVELETTAGRDELQTLFEPSGLQKLSFNGGVYIMYFEGEIAFATVLHLLGEARLPVKYIRDISASSRRFLMPEPFPFVYDTSDK